MATEMHNGCQPVPAAGRRRLRPDLDHVDPQGGGDHRRRLVEPATGEVLEIGAGTGRNLPLYRNATRVVALEPGPGMRARATQAARAAPVTVQVVDGTAEALPFPLPPLHRGHVRQINANNTPVCDTAKVA